MHIENTQGHFEARLLKIREEARDKSLRLHDVVHLLGVDSLALILIFFCLPYLQPFPLPGLSTPLGFIKAYIVWLIFREQEFTLPKKFQDLEVSSQALNKMIDVALKVQRVFSKFSKQRLTFVFELTAFRVLNLTICLISAFMLTLPIPLPLSNTVPAMPILIYAFGLLEEDGLAVMISWVFFVIELFFFASIIRMIWSLDWQAIALKIQSYTNWLSF